MIHEPTVWGIVMILLGIIDLLLFFVYALLRERTLNRREESLYRGDTVEWTGHNNGRELTLRDDPAFTGNETE